MSTISNERLEKLSEYDCADRYEVMSMATELLALRKKRERAEPVVDDIDTRMKEAGMLSVTEIIAGRQIDAFMRHAGVVDLESLLQWAEMRRAEFLRMQARYDIGDKPEDDMYEWVISHVAAFSELHINIRAIMSQPCQAETDTTSQQFESLAWRTIGGSDGFECTPVADLYELMTKCGECYDYTTSAKVAADWIKEGYSAREYVKLDRLQEAMTQGSSGEADGWIPCGERMPEDGVSVLACCKCGDNFSGIYTMRAPVIRSKNSRKDDSVVHHERVTHWQPLPEPPCK
ncbi:DUF551 domain-containing protein [Cronobacter sakazakii]